jgi:Family of unknown function (DUF5681)
MAAEKSGKLRTGQGSGDKPKRTLPQALRAHTWKPGQSGNPGGRPKKLTQPLEAFLARKDKSGKQYAQLLIEAMVKRAISRSDALIKEIFDRVEGRIAKAEETSAPRGNVIIMDIPHPPKVIDVDSNGHKPSPAANGKPPSDNDD